MLSYSNLDPLEHSNSGNAYFIFDYYWDDYILPNVNVNPTSNSFFIFSGDP